jgi:hypothetical protein
VDPAIDVELLGLRHEYYVPGLQRYVLPAVARERRKLEFGDLVVVSAAALSHRGRRAFSRPRDRA